MKISLIISDSFYYTKQTINKIFPNEEDIIKIDYSNVELSDILYELTSISLFSDHKKVVVENADELFSKSFESDDLENYLNNPSEFTEVIFVVNKADKTNKYYKLINSKYEIYDNTVKKKYNNIVDVKNYVKEKKSHISDNALSYIKDACLNDYDLMLREIDKLLILGKDNISDELVYGLVSLTPDGNNRRFIDALMDQNATDALNCVENMKVLNIDISKMIALIAWNVRVTYLIKKYRKDKVMLDKVLKQYNVADYAYNSFVRRGNIKSEEELENLLIELANIDIDLKTFKLDRKNVGYLLVNLFCI
ncbi:MAG: DNA polymerase III subunit delta [Bacilli bacterium]|nr:DNA polymerase III subunit delta [Bacilli bacterium]